MALLRNLFLTAIGSLLLALISGTALQAETWTDRTGQYKIEAEYVGVDGASVVLRKPDGTTVNVPIDRLSDASRDRARQLYQAAKAGRPITPATAETQSSAITPLAGSMAGTEFKPPVPPAVAPMPPFPDDASLQDTVDFIRLQILSGHPEVVWYALPERLRVVLDGSDYRSGVASLRSNATTNEAVMTMLMKAVEVLVTKKEFVLNSQLMTQVPTPFQPLVRGAYDPAVGMMYEFAMLTLAMDELEAKTLTQFFDDHGSRLGGHLQALIKVLPPGVVDQYVSQMTVQQEDETHGTITIPKPDGGVETIRMMKVDGRWLPEELAMKWQDAGDHFEEVVKAEMEKYKKTQEANAGQSQQADALMGSAVMMVSGLLEPMLKANTQQQFDQALMQVEAMAKMFSGMGPGGPGDAEAFAPPNALGSDPAEVVP